MKNWTKIKSKKGLTIWRDNQTGLLWSPPTKNVYTYATAMAIKAETFDTEFGKFKNRTWAVPTQEEIHIALAHGLSDLDPKFDSYNWSASGFSGSHSFAWMFNSSYGYVYLSCRSITFAVRCIGL